MAISTFTSTWESNKSTEVVCGFLQFCRAIIMIVSWNMLWMVPIASFLTCSLVSLYSEKLCQC